MTDTTQPTITQMAEAFAQALLPLAGPAGIAADGVMTAGLNFLSNLQAQKAGAVYTMDDLNAAAAKTTTDLAQLEADVAAQG